MQASIRGITNYSNGTIGINVDFVNENHEIVQSTTYTLQNGDEVSTIYPQIKEDLNKLVSTAQILNDMPKVIGIVDLSEVQSTSEIAVQEADTQLSQNVIE